MDPGLRQPGVHPCFQALVGPGEDGDSHGTQDQREAQTQALHAGTNITSAKAIIIAAPAVRTVELSTPNAGPSAPKNTPMAAKDSVMPRLIARGAKRLP